MSKVKNKGKQHKNVVFKMLRFNDEEMKKDISANPSVISLSQVTEASLEIWRTLPEKIRQDPSLASFRQEHERLHGK